MIINSILLFQDDDLIKFTYKSIRSKFCIINKLQQSWVNGIIFAVTIRMLSCNTKTDDMNNKQILICDDNQEILDVIEMMLTMHDFSAITEIDSTKLIGKIRENKPDLILLDLWMPLLSGEQILRTIRSTDSMKDIPVIVFSASVHGDDIAFEAGADDFIAKPFDMNDLLFKINTHIRRISEDDIITN